MSVQRMGMVIGVRPEKLDLYRELHSNPWPEIDAAMSAAHIHNFSIFLREPENLLFGYWEYSGTDYETDMQVLAGLAISKKWAALTDPCQAKLPTASAAEWWSYMPQIYYFK